MAGRILGIENTPTSIVASGIWNLVEQFDYKSQNLWPQTISFGLRAFTQFDTAASSSTLQLSQPSNSIFGELLMAFVNATDSRSITVVPTGWTLVDSTAGANTPAYLYTKLVDSDPGPWTWTFSATTIPDGFIINFGLAQIEGTSTYIDSLGGSFNMPSISFGSSTNIDVIIGGGRNYLSTYPTSDFTLGFSSTDGRSDNYFIYRDNVTPTTTGTAAMQHTSKDMSVIRAVLCPKYSATSTYITNVSNLNALTTYDFNPGTLTPGLYCIVVHSENPSASGSITNPATSVTIGSTSATQAVSASVTMTSEAPTSIWYGYIDSSTTSVVVTFGTAPNRAAIGVYRIDNANSRIPTSTYLNVTSTYPTSRSVTTDPIPGGSAIVAGATAGDNITWTWSGGVTENYDTSLAGLSGTSITGSTLSTTGLSQTYTITATSSATPAQGTSLVVAVWS